MISWRLAACLALAASGLSGCSAILKHAAGPNTSPPHAARTAPLPTIPLGYLGVYETRAPVSYAAINRFGQKVGRMPNIALYYSGWDEPFRVGFAATARAHGATVLVQINPHGISLGRLAQGYYDAYLQQYASEVRDYKHPVIIGFAHEMNGPWYTWGKGHTPAVTWIAAWRHLVTVFRRQGAENVTWLWTINRMNTRIGNPRLWWPGSQYVTWIGIDGYFYSADDTFQKIFGRTLDTLRQFTNKPIILAETSVCPTATPAMEIPDLFSGMKANRLLGLIWFDQPGRHDWRLEDDRADLALFREQSARYRLAA